MVYLSMLIITMLSASVFSVCLAMEFNAASITSSVQPKTEMIENDCPVCFETLNVTAGFPAVIVLMCDGNVAHNYCFKCFKSIYYSSKKPFCSLCRTPIPAAYEHIIKAGELVSKSTTASNNLQEEQILVKGLAVLCLNQLHELARHTQRPREQIERTTGQRLSLVVYKPWQKVLTLWSGITGYAHEVSNRVIYRRR